MRLSGWMVAVAAFLAVGRLPAPAFGEGEGKEAKAGPPLSVSEEREILDFVREQDPEMGKHLLEATKDNPGMFHMKMAELANMYRNPDLRPIFSRNLKAEAKVRRLSEAYRKASGKEKESMRADLEQALGEQFDAKLAGHETHIQKMQEEISRQKERIAKRKALKEQIVKKRVAEMSGDVESWDW